MNTNLTVAQKKKLVKELRKASALHKGQADLIEKTIKKQAKKK